MNPFQLLILWWLLFPRAVFISYAHEDRTYAEFAHRELARAGCRVWWDEDIRPGAIWEQEIERAIDRSDVVVVLLGSRCDGCRGEYLRALGKRTIVPVLLWPDANVPVTLAPLQRVSLDRLESLCRDVITAQE